MSEAAVFDKEGALDRVEGDTELFFELVGVFLEEYPKTLAKLSEAVSNNDAKAVESEAHSVKSALGNVGAMTSHALAFELEKAGRNGELSSANELLAQLKEHIDLYLKEVEVFRGEV